MDKRMLLPLLLFFFVFPVRTSAQLTSASESLLIGPGDMLRVQVYDTPQMEQHPRVDDAGNIPLLFLSQLAVAGQTPSQAAQAIVSRMLQEGLMKHPQVTVAIEQYATQDVSVLGQVAKPGVYPIGTPRSIFDVLSMAGGMTPLAEHNVTIRRHGEHGRQESFFVVNTPDSSFVSDLKIFPGDTIIVPRVSFVYVMGDVARPGGYPMSSNDRHLTVLEMLAEAGSVNRTATLSGARLLRKNGAGYSTVPVNFGSLQRGKGQDVVLEADDVIFIPFSYTRNFC